MQLFESTHPRGFIHLFTDTSSLPSLPACGESLNVSDALIVDLSGRVSPDLRIDSDAYS